MNARYVAAAMLALGMSACSAPPPDAPPRATTTVTATATSTETITATPEPTPSTTRTTPAAQTTPSTDGKGDRTDDLLAANPRQPWRSKVIMVTENAPGEVVVTTTIRDPRGGRDGSPEAEEAIEICKAAVTLLRAEGIATLNVKVSESNGSTFAYASSKLSQARCVEY